ncbi:MAG: acyl-CoA thioesterase [Elusimicrobiota bacterium]|nr:acyl-CoA thioesterase [Elusimicrobiota bacterium]
MNTLSIRISYSDTDQMGMVYYSNYLVFFERGRTELFRSLGISYKELEEKECFFPVVRSECNYFAPARYDDIINVETKIAEIGAASVTLYYEIKRDGKILASGITKHPLVNKDLKPIRFPKEIKEKLEQYLEK